MYQSYRIWDGKSALAGCPNATPEALDKAWNLTERNLMLVVYKDENGNENNIKTYPAGTAEDTIKTDFDAEVARQKAAEEAAAEEAAKPTIESRVAALESAQLEALGV